MEFYESLKKTNNKYKNNKIQSIHNFMNIWGVGLKKAHNIVNKKIYSINQLRNIVSKNNIKLTYQQKLGLKYYNNLKKRILRKEILEYTNSLKKLFKKYSFIKIHNAGSYRIGKADSGDIDLILTYEDENKTKNKTKNKINKINKINKKYVKELFFEIMYKNNLIIDILSSGKDKTIFITKNNINKKNIYRKVDVAIIEKSVLPWYLLYFGSSRDFSKQIRTLASKKGYKLTEKGLFNKISGTKINFKPKNEKDIFKYLDINYIKPIDR